MKPIDLNEKHAKIMKFAQWTMDKIGIEKRPQIELTDDIAIVKKHRAYGATTPDGRIWTYVGNRTPADAMRTLCHEILHAKQFEDGVATTDMDEKQEQHIEDLANAHAGRMMRKYGKKDATIYESKLGGKIILFINGEPQQAFADEYEAKMMVDYLKSKSPQAKFELKREECHWEPVRETTTETINQDTTKYSFNAKKQVGEYLLTAGGINGGGATDGGVQIKCFDGEKEVGEAILLIKGNHLTSDWTYVSPKYRGRGIPELMYGYARELGNTIKSANPKDAQTPEGKRMWKRFKQSGFADTIMNERVDQELFDPDYYQSKLFGNYELRAKPHDYVFTVSIYNPELDQAIGYIDFQKVGDDLVSIGTWVEPEYRGRGFAKAMYKFARELGATIRPAPRGSKTPDGKKMWKAFDKSGFSKEIMTEYNRIIKPDAVGSLYYKRNFHDYPPGHNGQLVKHVIRNKDADREIAKIAERYGVDPSELHFVPITLSKAKELIAQHKQTLGLNEGKEGSLIHDVADSLPYAYSIPDLDSSNNPYLQYKFSVAIAGARGKKSRDLDGINPFHDGSEAEYFNDEEVVISFDPNIGEIIDQAMADIGMKGGKRVIGVKGSKESKDVDKKSPVQGFKGYPRR